jgi:hypothetical protein
MELLVGLMKNMFKQLEIKNNTAFDGAIYGAFLLVAGLVLPAFLIFIINFIGHSEIIEEVAKALVVLFLILKFSTFKQKIGAGITFGFLFGVSENFFYLNQIFQFGDGGVFWQRFYLPLPMHIITVLIMLFFASISKKFIFLGMIIAIVVHIVFNSFC